MNDTGSKLMKSRKALTIAALCLFTTGAVLAKLPPLTEEQKAKAEEAKVKAAEVAKMEADQLSKSQDRVAARYIQQQKAKGVTVTPTVIPAPAAASPAQAAPAAPAPAKK